ncbi:hypothetical protein ACRQ5Q_06975 [Bradyrhizobium sp. PMVTL-01]|uniref:hypothetical protein n=1 Tax=unclassified Bradyrhizobium TaxID=2631580 RepID=UPI003F6EF297
MRATGKTGLDNVRAEEWNRIYDVNVRGPILCCRAAMPKFDNAQTLAIDSGLSGM